MRPRCVQASAFLPREAGGDIKDDTALPISTTSIELQLRQSKKLLMPPGQSPSLFTGVFVREQVIIATASLGPCVRLGRSHKKTLLAVLGLSGSHTCRAVLLRLSSDRRQMAPGMTEVICWLHLGLACVSGFSLSLISQRWPLCGQSHQF